VSELDPAAFPLERATVRDGLEVAYVRANPGGFPLLLVHGWPETMRIWWRNVEPLAAAGFEVIVPDLRGFGQSGLAPDGHYDMAASARDLHALVHDVLGHERCVPAGGDYGGVVIQDLGLRFPGFVVRQCLFNTVLPLLPTEYEAAGISPEPPRRARMAADYFVRQGSDADGLAAELDTPAQRRRYVAGMYGHRFWAAPGAFTPEAVDFMTEPFADPDKLRASFGLYESAMGARPPSEPPRFFEPNPVPTLVLYGPEDHVIWPDFPERTEVAFPNRVGPFVVAGAGHFLQWERADVLNGALAGFCRDLV
jgi:pimeloyl-ACP methyl ester carboxylesterase